MTLHIVHCDRVEARPWRNGGGRTRELLAWPDANDWHVRISVADIDRDGPFSPYPGVERWFAVLEGAGVMLGLADGPQRVDATREPLRFPGEQTPECALLDGSTRDLNLMCRRMHGCASMQRAEPGMDFVGDTALRALFCADAVTLQIDGCETQSLPPFTLLWCDGGAASRWRLHSRLARPRAWWLSFDATRASSGRIASGATGGEGARR